MTKPYADREVWFLTGSQDLYGEDTLRQVAEQSQAIKEQGHGATLEGVATEVEHGKTMYEAAFKVNGHSKDITFDVQGQIVSVEEETPLHQLPSAAREAIQKAAGKGKVLEVETVTESGKTFYEAQIKSGGKKLEVKVNAAGQPVK